MELKFEIKKTYELSKEELSQIVSLFTSVFEREMTEEVLHKAYTSTPLGYSYHSIMKDEGKICGLNSFEPFYFLYHGEKRLFVCSVTTMIEKKYRGASNFFYIVSKAYPYLKNEGVSLVYAYPNDNSYPVFTKMRLLNDVGSMYTYCLPLRIGAIKPSLSFFNSISMIVCKAWVCMSSLFCKDTVYKFKIEKDSTTFDKFRYSKNTDDVYKRSQINDAVLYYRVKRHEGVRTIFFIDLSRKSPRNFVDAVRYLIREESRNADLILYPGYLPFKLTGMIKLPEKLSPKKFRLTARILDEAVFDADVWDIKNWDTNLSNYDLI